MRASGYTADTVCTKVPLRSVCCDVQLPRGYKIFNFAGTIALVGRKGLQGAAQVISHAQKIAGEIRGGVKRRFGFLALGALSEIFHLGRQAQQAVLEGGRLLLQNDDFLIALVKRSRLHRGLHFDAFQAWLG